MRRFAVLLVAAASVVTVGSALAAAPSPSLTVFTSNGAVIGTYDEIPGTPCWDAAPYVVAPEGVSFAECTPPAPTTTAAPSTTQPPTTTVPPTTTEPPPPATTQPPVTTAPPASGAQFVETFDTPASLDRFDFAVHHAWTANATKSAWIGDHDLSCGPPEPGRVVENPTVRGQTYFPGMRDPVVYWCKEHMMTSFNTSHYAQVDFSPQGVFTDVSRVCWRQNRTDLGSRRWTQLVVVPLDTFTANNGRLDYVASRFSPTGPGKYGIHPTDETLLVEVGKGDPRVQVGQSVDDQRGAWDAGADKMTRYQICVENYGSGLRITYETDGSPDVYLRAGRIPAGPVRVIFQDDLYNPDKSPGVPNGNTWHWDDIEIE